MEGKYMSTITLNNHAAVRRQNKITLKERIKDYFIQNQAVITLGLFAVSGRTPDLQMLRDLKML